MKEIPYLSPKTHQTTFEIDLKALVANLNYYKSTLKPETKIIVMVKAFAYGLGLSKISEVLANQNIDYLAVAYTDEAVELRKAGYEGKLMVFNPELECFDNIIQYNIEPEIYNLSLLKGFLEHIKNNAAYQLIKPFKVHIKIDTGMHRLGFMPYELEEAATLIVESKALKLFGYGHVAPETIWYYNDKIPNIFSSDSTYNLPFDKEFALIASKVIGLAEWEAIVLLLFNDKKADQIGSIGVGRGFPSNSASFLPVCLSTCLSWSISLPPFLGLCRLNWCSA